MQLIYYVNLLSYTSLVSIHQIHAHLKIEGHGRNIYTLTTHSPTPNQGKPKFTSTKPNLKRILAYEPSSSSLKCYYQPLRILHYLNKVTRKVYKSYYLGNLYPTWGMLNHLIPLNTKDKKSQNQHFMFFAQEGLTSLRVFTPNLTSRSLLT